MPRLVRDGETTHATAAPTATAPVPAPAETQPIARQNQAVKSNKKDNDSAKPAPPKRKKRKQHPQKQNKVGDKPGAKIFIPPPPPDVPEIQLRMWSATLRQRMKQLKQLSSEDLAGLAEEIKEDLQSSRNGTNEYSAALALVLRKSEKKDGDSSETEDIDLAAGVYSVLFLQEEVSPEAIGRHFLALFYQSIDKRLPPAMNKYGMTALREAFSSLDRWRKGEGEKPTKKRKASDGVDINTGKSDKAKIARKDTNEENPFNGQEQVVSTTASETVNLTSEETTLALAQPSATGAPNKEQPTHQPEKNVDDTSGNVYDDMEDSIENKKSSNGSNDEVHDTTLPAKANETANSETLVSLDAEQSRQLQSLYAKYKAAVESSTGGSTGETVARIDATTNGSRSASLNTDSVEPVVEGQGIQSQETQNVTASTTLTSTDISANDVRIVSTDLEEGNTPAVRCPTVQDHNGGGVSESIGTTKDASSNIPVGFRRHTLRNCHIDGCPNKGGVCVLHGKLGKTCKIDGCDNFQVNGYDVCVKHGGKSCKTVGCKKKSFRNGLCIDHFQETVSASEQATTQLGEASAKPGSRAQTANHYEAENSAPAGELSVRSQIQEVSQDARMEHSSSFNNDLPNGLQNSSEHSQTAPSAAGPCVDEWIDLTGDSPAKEAQTKQLALPTTSPHPSTIFKEDLPSKHRSTPPPSPPPTTIIRNPPPPPKPQPSAFSHRHSITFAPDTVIDRGTISGCLKDYARGQMMVEFDLGYHIDGSGMSLNDAACIDVKERLNTWEPYWRIIDELGHHDIRCENFVTNIGTKTACCCPIPYDPLRNVYSSLHSCAMVRIDFVNEIAKSKLANTDGKGRNVEGFRPWGVKWGKEAKTDSHQLGDRRMLMRCIPLNRSAADKKKRADLHLWPIGSFVQIKLGNGGDQVIPVFQRKQQSHAHNKWLGNSLPLDLTGYIPDLSNPLQIYISSKEVIEQASEGGEGLLGSYAVHTAVCEYIDPDTLYYQLMGKSEGGDILMPKLSLRSGKKMLKECISNNTITLDSDDEEGGGDSEDDFLTFSLLCHASKKCIETPVRGQCCTHLQCFDLRNYLITNKVVSAGRWRCPNCENFVSVRDLVHCGLFQAILDDLREQIVVGVRDRVCVKADGSWYLLDENKVRNKKSGITADTASSAIEANDSKATEPDVIELV